MKAVVQERYESPEVLELRELGAPRPGDGDVLVRVRAAAVNPYDWHFLRGSLFVLRLTGGGLLAPKLTGTSWPARSPSRGATTSAS